MDLKQNIQLERINVGRISKRHHVYSDLRFHEYVFYLSRLPNLLSAKGETIDLKKYGRDFRTIPRAGSVSLCAFLCDVLVGVRK